MRVKKSELRKRLPQLPINYPGPEVVPFDYELERQKVENLCKRLADNEVEVRDAVLDELPRYLKEVCAQYTAKLKRKAEADAAASAAGAPKVDLKKRRLDENGKVRRLTRKERIELRHAEERKRTMGESMEDDQLFLILSKLSLGLFFCMWHSDKPLVQHACAASISRLMHYPTTTEHKLVFLRAFLRVMSKKWTQIDQWRIDKYMALMRKVLYEYLRFLQHLRISDEGKKISPLTAEEQEAADAAASESTPAAETEGRKSSKLGKKRSRQDAAAEATPAAAGASGAGRTVYEVAVEYSIKVWQEEVINGTAAGLAMHIADVFLDEMIRAKVQDEELFIQLSRGIPVYTMQRGNHIEKRVVDHFYTPIAAGELEKLVKAKEGEEEADDDEAYENLPPASEQIYFKLVKRLLAVTKECSVSTRTQYAIRPLFSECQLFLEHYLKQQEAPEAFEPMNEKDQRLRMAREIVHAQSARSQREEVVQKRLVKKSKEKRELIKKGLIKKKQPTRRKKVR